MLPCYHGDDCSESENVDCCEDFIQDGTEENQEEVNPMETKIRFEIAHKR